MSRNLCATYTCHYGDYHLGASSKIERQTQKRLSPRQYQIYSGRGGRRSDRVAGRACVSCALGAVCAACAALGPGGPALLVCGCVLLALGAVQALKARRLTLAWRMRCAYYSR